MARPSSTQQVSAILRQCSLDGIRVVPQGGLTGLVGAAVAEDCILPISIGGNVSTNAGGFNVLHHGMTRDLVLGLGLEVVLADGRIWNGLKRLRKDNRGYDLKQMFIGAEGTLGVITAASLELFPKPTQVETALVGVRSVEHAISPSIAPSWPPPATRTSPAPSTCSATTSSPASGSAWRGCRRWSWTNICARCGRSIRPSCRPIETRKAALDHLTRSRRHFELARKQAL